MLCAVQTRRRPLASALAQLPINLLGMAGGPLGCNWWNQVKFSITFLPIQREHVDILTGRGPITIYIYIHICVYIYIHIYDVSIGHTHILDTDIMYETNRQIKGLTQFQWRQTTAFFWVANPWCQLWVSKVLSSQDGSLDVTPNPKLLMQVGDDPREPGEGWERREFRWWRSRFKHKSSAKTDLNMLEFRYNMLEFRVSGGGFLRAAQVATMLWAWKPCSVAGSLKGIWGNHPWFAHRIGR